MKNPKKVETPSIVGTLAKIILSLILLGFAGLAIHNIRTLRVELDNSSSTVEELQTKTEQTNDELKNLEEQNKSLQQEKQNLEQKNKELEEKLQAKLEAQKKAKEQSTLASQKVQINGTCRDWMAKAGITDFENAYYIFQRESNCNPTAINKSSGAYGVCQSLPANKMQTAGADWKTNPITQMKWCQNYAQSRYGSWSNAVAFWKANNWW